MFCPLGELAGKEFLIEREAIIGRASGNEIVLSSPVVSAQHARLYYSDQDEAFWIEDLGSRNGTRIDGRPLVRPRKLGSLHVVTLADGLDFVVQIVSDDFVPEDKRLKVPPAVDATVRGMAAPVLPEKLSSETEREASLQPRPEREQTVFKAAPILAPDFDAPAQPPSPAARHEVTNQREVAPIAPASLNKRPEDIRDEPKPEPSADPEPESDRPRFSQFILMAENKDGSASSYRLSPGENLIGRLEECSIRIQHPTVSRRHAAITVKGTRVFLRELGGLNPVLLAGDKVEGEVEVHLNQEIQIGQVKVVLVKR
ncbi:MAG: FHA domain-containing protein [Acidobacteriota bacterium]